MKLSVLVLLIAVCMVLVQDADAAHRDKRTLGSWFKGFFKSQKKPQRRPVYVRAPQPGYGPPPHPQQQYGPPPAPAYGPPPAHAYGPPPVATYAPPPTVGYGPPPLQHHGKGHSKGHVKGHGKGAEIPHGFGPPKQPDVIGHGAHPQPSYGPPPPQDYAPPPAAAYAPPQPAPVYSEPAPAPVYSEPPPPTYVAPAPTYSEPAPAPAPTYSEPPPPPAPIYSEPAPTYNEPPPPPAPIYSEPAPASIYSEPAPASIYSEPAPTYSEPAAPAPTYSEPAAPAPTYSEPAAPAPTYSEPAVPAPTYSEPAADGYEELRPSSISAQEPAPTYSEPAPAPAPTYSEPAPAPAPTYSEPAPAPAPTYSEPAPPAPTYSEPVGPEPTYSEPAAPAPTYSEPAADGYDEPRSTSLFAQDTNSAYKAPETFPPPMAEHGTSSSNYFDDFKPSAPIPPAPQNNFIAVGPAGAPAPAVTAAPGTAPEEVFIAPEPAYSEPAAPEPTYSEPAAPAPTYSEPASVPTDDYSAPVDNYVAPTDSATGYSDQNANVIQIEAGGGGGSYHAQLGYDDPIIEIVFEDAEAAPAPPAPSFHPDLFAIPEEPVEVYFVEYSPDDPPVDVSQLNLDSAQPAILEDLPTELPADIREQLWASGVLDDAQIQVIDLQNPFKRETLDADVQAAIEAIYGEESNLVQSFAKPPQAVDFRMKRLIEHGKSPESVAEILTSLGNFRDGRFAGLVEVNDKDADKFIPFTVDGDRFPLPDHPSLKGRDISGVLVLAENEEVLAESPQHNLVKESSPIELTRTARGSPQHTPIKAIDRTWNNDDPDDWRPIFY